VVPAALIAATSSPDLGSLEWLRTNGVRILIIIAVALLMSRIASLWIRRLRKKLDAEPTGTGAINLRRTTTIVGTLTSTMRVVIWTIAGFMVLGELGVNLGPLIASAGIIGVGLGFGAQSLVRDFLSGFFIVLENQYTVGDAVQIFSDVGSVTVTGRVEELTLRTTSVRADDGTLHVIANGFVHVVANLSRGQTDLEVEVRIPRGEDPEEVRTLIAALCREMRDDQRLAPRLFSGPDVLGVEQIDAETVILRVGASTSPARADQIREEVRKRIERRMAPIPNHIDLTAP
jgi:moderate conductance mechanosensitive channel